MRHCTTCGVYFDAPLVREGTDPTVAPGYRYRNHYIVYNQDGPEAQLVWCVFLSADKPEGMKTEEPQ